MKEILKYSKDRSLLINTICSLVCFLMILLLPSIIAVILINKTDNQMVVSLIAYIIMIAIMVFMYYKDLIKEAKLFKKNLKSNIKISFKDYAIGLLLMIFCNLIIFVLLRHISSNESQVRELLYSNVVLSMINISILGPISEELIFRKSIMPIFKNKWVYIIISGFLFGFAHILTNIFSGSFVLTDLIYIIPYGCFGGSFALMNYEGNTTFNSIMIHAFHNTWTAVFLLIAYFNGVGV